VESIAKFGFLVSLEGICQPSFKINSVAIATSSVMEEAHWSLIFGSSFVNKGLDNERVFWRL
jgi:hypothetical protein